MTHKNIFFRRACIEKVQKKTTLYYQIWRGFGILKAFIFSFFSMLLSAHEHPNQVKIWVKKKISTRAKATGKRQGQICCPQYL